MTSIIVSYRHNPTWHVTTLGLCLVHKECPGALWRLFDGFDFTIARTNVQRFVEWATSTNKLSHHFWSHPRSYVFLYAFQDKFPFINLSFSHFSFSCFWVVWFHYAELHRHRAQSTKNTEKRGEEQKNDENLFQKIILRDFPHASQCKSFFLFAFIVTRKKWKILFPFRQIIEVEAIFSGDLLVRLRSAFPHQNFSF